MHLDRYFRLQPLPDIGGRAWVRRLCLWGMLTIVVCLIEGPVNAHFERAGIGISKVTEYLKFVTDFGPAPLGIGENVVVFNPSPSKEPSGASGNLLKVFRPNIGRLGGDSYFWAGQVLSLLDKRDWGGVIPGRTAGAVRSA